MAGGLKKHAELSADGLVPLLYVEASGTRTRRECVLTFAFVAVVAGEGVFPRGAACTPQRGGSVRTDTSVSEPMKMGDTATNTCISTAAAAVAACHSNSRGTMMDIHSKGACRR